MRWSERNVADIENRGFTFLPDRIDAELVQRALRLIKGDFEASGGLTDDEWSECSHSTFCKALVDADQLNFLAIDSGAFDFATEGIGLLEDGLRAQVARRRIGDKGSPHIDGFYPQDSGAVDTPDGVLGIYLTDVTKPEDGAFTVWPNARCIVREWAAALNSVPARSSDVPQLDAVDGDPVLGLSGKAFLVHGALPHCNVERTVNGFRDAVFFRLYRAAPHRNVLTLLQSGGVKW